MKQFKGYDEAKQAAQFTGGKLPEGAYICKILEVKYKPSEDSSKSDIIEVMFDITEGECKDFFAQQYKQNASEDKKWKGRASVYVPLDDGSERDGWTKNAFAKWTDSLEKSNNGYYWDWDETKWKGKAIGIVFGTTGTVIDGKEVTYTEARFPVAVSLVKEGKAPKAKFKAKNGYGKSPAPTVTGNESWMQIPDTDEDSLPF